jgi:hypothetical protein
MDRDLEGSLMALADNLAHPYNRRKTCCALTSSPNDRWLIGCDVGQVVTIGVLPDDVLLTIFDFYVVRYQDLDSDSIASDVVLSYEDTKTKIRSSQSLVHVCRRWRGLVFASPRRLNLQLCCTTKTPARKTLDVWPALPLLILGGVSETSVGNVIAELEHSNRICKIDPQLPRLYRFAHKKTLDSDAGVIPGARSSVPVI